MATLEEKAPQAKQQLTVVQLKEFGKSLLGFVTRRASIIVGLVLLAALGYGALTVSGTLEQAVTSLADGSVTTSDYSLNFDSDTRNKIDELANKKNTPVDIPSTGRINPFSE